MGISLFLISIDIALYVYTSPPVFMIKKTAYLIKRLATSGCRGIDNLQMQYFKNPMQRTIYPDLENKRSKVLTCKFKSRCYR